jgi:hypothetical protein
VAGLRLNRVVSVGHRFAQLGVAVAEGFEPAEDDLIEAAETAGAWANPHRTRVRRTDKEA